MRDNARGRKIRARRERGGALCEPPRFSFGFAPFLRRTRTTITSTRCTTSGRRAPKCREEVARLSGGARPRARFAFFSPLRDASESTVVLPEHTGRYAAGGRAFRIWGCSDDGAPYCPYSRRRYNLSGGTRRFKERRTTQSGSVIDVLDRSLWEVESISAPSATGVSVASQWREASPRSTDHGFHSP